MYVKIQEDISDRYLLIEANEVEASNVKVGMPYTDYVKNIIPVLIEYNELDNIQRGVGVTLRTIFGTPDFPSTKAVTSYTIAECKDVNENTADFACQVKGVKVNGKCYVTCGNIYIMNDKGHTIQKL